MSLILKGSVWKFGDNISTDLLMPGYAVKTRPDMTDKEAAEYVMRSNRPDWAEQVKRGDILVGGRNFGCGSSRVAAGPLKALGISCVISESMARIFFRNCINSGLPVLIAPGITCFCRERDILKVDINRGVIKNLTRNSKIKVEPLDEESPPMQIMKAGGIIPLLEEKYLNKK